MNAPMIRLGVDWGRARTGLAVSDELGMLAHPAGFIQNAGPRRLAAALAAEAARRGALEIVLGLPLHMEGGEGESAAEVRRLGDRLEDEHGLQVVYWDERLSTWEAARRLPKNVKSSRSGRGRLDQAAACVMLQAFLDSRSSSDK